MDTTVVTYSYCLIVTRYGSIGSLIKVAMPKESPGKLPRVAKVKTNTFVWQTILDLAILTKAFLEHV